MAIRIVVTALSAVIAILLIVQGHVLIGLVLSALVVARVAMLVAVMRRRSARRDIRARRRERLLSARQRRID